MIGSHGVFAGITQTGRWQGRNRALCKKTITTFDWIAIKQNSDIQCSKHYHIKIQTKKFKMYQM